MRRKVCLSGFAKMSREWANEQADGVEIWGMNEGHAFLKRKPARWFQVHPKGWNERVVKKNEWPEGNFGRHPAHVEWLSKQECPVYMQEVDERIPSSVEYPIDEIVEKYGRYLTSTIAYMLALLLYEHESAKWWKPWTWKRRVESFTMAGIEMSIGTEYMIQRPCVEYFIGRLESKGVKFISPPLGTSILHGPLYAIDHKAPILEGELVPVYAGSMYNTSALNEVNLIDEEDAKPANAAD